MARMKGDGQPFALATVVRTRDATSAKVGAKAVVRADGSMVGWVGGGCTLGAVRKAAAEALLDGRARMIRVRPDGAGPAEAEPHRPADLGDGARSPPGGGRSGFFRPSRGRGPATLPPSPDPARDLGPDRADRRSPRGFAGRRLLWRALSRPADRRRHPRRVGGEVGQGGQGQAHRQGQAMSGEGR
ncbi:MAG: XdhC family protein [Proteobacteria bacterium]|nr:XdhC family protein [Pseudomonadota bacterium]